MSDLREVLEIQNSGGGDDDDDDDAEVSHEEIISVQMALEQLELTLQAKEKITKINI